jgi:histidyl-tRNA synthetase
MGEAGERFALRLLAVLRRDGVAADMAYRGNFKKRLQRADSSGARFAVIIGDSEIEAGTAQLKNLTTGEQQAVAFESLAGALKA